MTAPSFFIAPLDMNPDTLSSFPTVPAKLAERLLARMNEEDVGVDEIFEIQPQYFKDPTPECLISTTQASVSRKRKLQQSTNIAGLKYQAKIRKLLSSVSEDNRDLACQELNDAIDNIAKKYQSC